MWPAIPCPAGLRSATSAVFSAQPRQASRILRVPLTVVWVGRSCGHLTSEKSAETVRTSPRANASTAEAWPIEPPPRQEEEAVSPGGLPLTE